MALGCALVVAAPALLRATTDATRLRGRTLPGPVRAGADVGLLVIAVVAYGQLRRRTSGTGGGVLSEDAAGRLGIDPVLVAAPALALLAGTVLTLRLLPLAARLAERIAARGRGPTAALAGWQLGRRLSTRGAGPVLLLVLSCALGMLAIGQRASWERSQDDQADFRAGAQVRVLSGRTPLWGQGGAYRDVPGVAAALPVGRAGLDLSGGRTSSLLALDARRSADALLLRGDLAGGDADDGTGAGARAVLRAVAPKNTAPAGIALPERTDRLRLTVTLRSLRALPVGQDQGRAPGASGPPAGTGPVPAALSLVLTDRHHAPATLPLGTVPADGRPHELTADLAAAAGAPTGRPAGPLRLNGLVADMDRTGVSHRQLLTVTAAHTVAPDGTARALRAPAGLAWRGRISDRSSVAAAESGPKAGPTRIPEGTLLAQTYDTGARPPDGYGAAVTTVRITAAHPARPLPAAVATDAYLRDSGSRVGSVVEVPVGGQPVKVRIVRAVRALPGPPAGQETAPAGLLADFTALNAALADRDAAPLPADEWWLRPAPGADTRVVAALRARPDIEPEQVLARDELAEELRHAPLGLGPQAALAAAAVAAVALAAVGFAVHAAGAARERAGEFAVLRALGAPRYQQARTTAVELGVLLAWALAAGAALGTVLTRAVVPLIILTEQADRPVPPVLVELPPGQVAALLAAVAAAVLLVVAATGLRRGDPVRALRGQGVG